MSTIAAYDLQQSLWHPLGFRDQWEQLVEKEGNYPWSSSLTLIKSVILSLQVHILLTEEKVTGLLLNVVCFMCL